MVIGMSADAAVCGRVLESMIAMFAAGIGSWSGHRLPAIGLVLIGGDCCSEVSVSRSVHLPVVSMGEPQSPTDTRSCRRKNRGTDQQTAQE